MASTSSEFAVPNRRLVRRQQTIEDALDAAVEIMERSGVGGLSMSEVARRLGMQQPSLYKYFSSLHALYDALFARGLRQTDEVVMAACELLPPGVVRIRAGGSAWVRWAVENPALSQLLVWRPVPGFTPAEETFSGSRDQMDVLRTEFAQAVHLRQLRADALSEEALRLYTVVLSGSDLPADGQSTRSWLRRRHFQQSHRDRVRPFLRSLRRHWRIGCRLSTMIR